MMVLRDYQRASVDSIFRYFESGNTGNPVVALPTGTGKSLVIGDFVRRAILAHRGTRIMKLTHVKELVGQNFQKLIDLWPTAPAGIYSAGLKRKDVGFPIVFGGVASVARCPVGTFGHIDLLLIDECHLVSPKEDAMYQRVIANLREVNPKLKVIGFTATPYRLGQGHLTEAGGIFTDVCFDMTNIECFNWLLAEGYLAPLIPKPTKTVLDISNVSISGGEYKQNELQAAVDIDAINHAACMEMITQGHDRKHWLIFASGIDHAVHLANALNHYDIKATYVHSKMPDSERDENIRAWKNGEYQAMVNNGILTTGVDFPAINLIGVLRPTRSASLWVQMLGRGTRPHPGKANCLVLDFANNITRLGPINDPICPRRRGKGAPRPAPVKLCNFCESWNHTSVRNCVVCGTAFPVEINIEGVANSQQLIVGAEDMRTEVFKVDSVVYNEHYKIGRPPSLRVSYFCGLRRFIEWIAFEHSAESNRMARRWWARRAPDYDMPPDTTEEALANVRTLKQPTHLRIWLKPKYDSILDYDFTGTAFGENTNDD